MSGINDKIEDAVAKMKASTKTVGKKTLIQTETMKI